MLTDCFAAALRGGLDSPEMDERVAATAGLFRLAELANILFAVHTKRPGKVSKRG